MTDGLPCELPLKAMTRLGFRRAAWGAALGSVAGLMVAWLGSGGSPLLPALNAAYDTLVPIGLRNALWDLRHHFWASREPLGEVARTVYLNPLNYLVVAAVFVLERVIPARREQRVFSRGMAQDFLWINADAAFKIVGLVAFIGFLKAVYDRHLGFLTVAAVTAWPAWAKVVFSLVVYDFLHYFHHVMRHRIQVLWYFHMIHHSQREMNVFTDGRVHVMEYLASKSLIFIPMFMFQVDAPSVFWIAFLTHWYTRVYHANLRTNYGPLKHVLVTPQSHRIHHSLNPAHYDTNFGVLFTVWDRAFGTLYPGYDEYPDTGIEDDRLPLEQMMDGFAVLRTYLAQTLYPFRLMARQSLRRA